MNTSVVILSRTEKNAHACIAALRDCEPEIPVVLVWDCSRGNGKAPWMTLYNCQIVNHDDTFCFARNANIGIQAAMKAGALHVVLLNDDALLRTPLGFQGLEDQWNQNQEYGVIAASTNVVGNPNQRCRNIGLREDPRIVCFICVFIPDRTLLEVGMMDEEFTGYGFEDDSYCLRVRRAGYKIGIWDGCFADHDPNSTGLHSTFRTGPNTADLFHQNREVFERKYGAKNHEL